MMAHADSSQSGFTLPELMVVLSIVGILATIGISHYRALTARTRQAEAKLGLAGIYIAQQTIYTEKNSYTVCLSKAGFNLDRPKRYYTIGFKDLGAQDCGPAGGAPCEGFEWSGTAPTICATAPTVGETYFQATTSYNSNIPRADNTLLPPTSITHTAFTASAIGNIAVSGAADYDQWTIDENKHLSNLATGF